MFGNENGDQRDIQAEALAVEMRLGEAVAKQLEGPSAKDAYLNPLVENSGRRIIVLTSGSYVFFISGESFDLQSEGIYSYDFIWANHEKKERGEMSFSPEYEDGKTSYYSETPEEGQAGNPEYVAKMHEVLLALEKAEYSEKETRRFTENEITPDKIEPWESLRGLVERNPPVVVLSYTNDRMMVAIRKYSEALEDAYTQDAVDRVEELYDDVLPLITDSLIQGEAIVPQRIPDTEKVLPIDDDPLIVEVRLNKTEGGMNYLLVEVFGREDFTHQREPKGRFIVTNADGATSVNIVGNDTIKMGVRNLFQKLQVAQLEAIAFRTAASQSPRNDNVHRLAHLFGLDLEHIRLSRDTQDVVNGSFMATYIDGVLESTDD